MDIEYTNQQWEYIQNNIENSYRKYLIFYDNFSYLKCKLFQPNSTLELR